MSTNDTTLTKGLNHWQSLSNPIYESVYGAPNLLEMQWLSTYVHNDIVHSCVATNAQAVASTYLGLYAPAAADAKGMKSKRVSPKTKKWLRKSHPRHTKAVAEPVEVVDGPLLSLLQNEEEDLDLSDMIRLVITYVQLFGRAYFYKLRDLSGNWVATQLLKPYYVMPFRDSDGKIIKYMYANISGGQQNGQTDPVELAKDDVIDFRWPSPADPYAGGDSPIQSAFDKIKLSSKWVEYQNWLMDNRARPDALLIPTADNISTEEAKRLELQFTERLKGARNGRPIIADSSYKYVPMTYQPADLAPLQFAQELKKAVCHVLFIPMALTEDDPNRAGIEGSLEQWARQAIAPLCAMIATKLNKALSAEFQTDLFVCFENPVPEDEAFELQELQANAIILNAAFLAQAATQNEYRVGIGLDEVPDGDVYKASPAPVVPTDESGSSEESEDTEPVQPAVEDQPSKSVDPSVLLSVNTMVADGKMDRATAINLTAKLLEIDDEEAKRLVTHPPKVKSCACGNCEGTKAKKPKTLPGMPLPDGSKLKALIVRHFKMEANHYLSQIGTHKGTISDNIKAIFSDVDTKAAGLPDKFVPVDHWTDDLAHSVKPVVELYAKKGAQYIEGRVGASPDVFSVVPAEITKAVDGLTLDFADSTVKTTAKQLNDALAQLRSELKEGLFDGDPVRELTKRVEGVFEGISQERAEMIAQTESSRATHAGLDIAAKASGVVKGFKWLLSEDACPICDEFDGVEVDLGENFQDGDGYDAIPYPPCHPMCRCTILEILKPDEEEQNSGE